MGIIKASFYLAISYFVANYIYNMKTYLSRLPYYRLVKPYLENIPLLMMIIMVFMMLLF